MRKLILSLFVLTLISAALYFTQRSQASVSTVIASAGTALSTQNGPLWKYPTNSVGCKSSSSEPYVSYTFDITTSGNYTFTMTPSGFPAASSGRIYVYHSLFNPNNKCSNLVNGQDSENDYIAGNPLTLSLNASQTPARFIVVFTAQNIVTCPNCPNQSTNPSNVNGTFSATVSGPTAVTLVPNVSTTIVDAGTPLNPETNYTWQYPVKFDCSTVSGTVPFAAQKIQVSTSGLYTFTMNTSGFPGVIHLYTNNFSLDEPCFNLANEQDPNGYAVTGNSVTIPISVVTPVTMVAVFSPKNPGDTETFSASVSGPAPVTVLSDDLHIVSQPSSKSVTSGCQQTLTVYAEGPTPQTFQWYDGIAGDLSTSILILGANSNTYNTPALTSDKSYWVRVTNGSDHVDSQTIEFKVYQSNKTQFNGSLDPNQTWNLMSTYCNTSGTFVHYSTTQIRIPVAGSYKITVNKGGNFSGGYAIHVYSGAFNATTPCLNFDDLSINSELTTHLSTGIHTIVVSANTTSEVDGDYAGSVSTNDDCSLPETLEQALIISGNPLDKAITPGNTATLNFAYTGGTSMAKIIQWYEGFSGDTSHPIVSATTPIYTTPTLNQLSPPYYYYWARVTDSGQSTYADTRTAVVNVLNQPITYADVLSQCDEVYPQVNGPTTYYKIFPFTVSTDGQYTFNVNANGFTPAVKLYQGFFSPAFPNINYYGPGATQTILAGPNTYYLVITSTEALQTGSFTLTINGPALVVPTPRPIITAQPSGADVFRGQTVTFNVSSSTPDVSYQWFTGTSCTNKTAVNGANSSSYTTPGMTDYQNFWVKVSYGVMYVNSNIAPVRIKPQAITDGYIIDEDTALDVAAPGLLTNDKKADSKTLTAFRVSDPILGLRSLNTDGAMSYTPNPNVNGPDVFKYKVFDGSMDSEPENVAILVRAINDPPVFTGGAFNNHTFNEDAPVGTLHLGGVAFGPGGGPDENIQLLTYKVTAIPPASMGNVVLSDNTTVVSADTTYTLSQIQGMGFKPAVNGFGGPAPFTITVTDNGESYLGLDPRSITKTLNITVNAVADTPSATNATTNEDTKSTSGLVLSRNAGDGLEVQYFKIGQIKSGTLYKNDGVTQIANAQFITVAEGQAGLKFSPNANLSSPGSIFSFQVEASLTNTLEGVGGNPLTVSITVNPVAEQPTVTGAATFVNLQTTSGLVVTRNPTDGSEIGYYKISSITNGTLYKANGTTQISSGQFITAAEGAAGIKFTPAQDSTASGSFLLQGSADASGNGLGPAATANITVSKYNTSTTISGDNPAPSYLDQQVTVSYSVLNTSGGPAPAGDVVVTISGGAETCTGTVAAGSCTLTLTNGGNPRTITATYAGNSQFNSSSGAKDHVVNACTQNTVVTSTADDGTGGTLRYLVANACAGSTITFDPTVFDPANGPYTISLGTFGNIVGNLLLDKNLTIKGPGANILTVRRSTNTHVLRFRIFNIAAGATVTISGLSIGNGYATGTTFDEAGIGKGGGILNAGSLTLEDCAVSGNKAGAQADTTGLGAGIYSSGSLTVINSTISGNDAVTDGGGIYLQAGSTSNIINSTVSGNTSPGKGGGIVSSGTAGIINSTIANNTATASGGGIYCETGTLNIGNSLVAGNTSATGPDVLQLSGIINTNGHNLIGKNDGAETAFVSGGPNANADLVGTSGSPVAALLGPLVDNGGSSPTHLPLPGSPALDAGSNANLPPDMFDLDGDSNTTEPLPLDQRGQARIANATVDIGAVEVSYGIAATSGASQSAVINSAFVTPMQATVTESGNPKSGTAVTFTAPENGAGGTFSGNLTATVTTDSNGLATAPDFTANGLVGNYSVVASLAAGPSATFNLTNTQAAAQVVLSNLTQVYDGTPKIVSTTTTPSGLPVAVTYDGSVIAPTNAGSYQVAAILTDLNYFGGTTGTLSIGKAGQTINFSALLNKTYGDADFPVSATSDSGLAVSFAATGTCTMTPASPGTVQITGVGSCTITATQDGNSNYNAALPVSQSFNIAKANQSLTFTALDNKTFADPDFTVSATSDAGLAVNLAATGNCTVTSPAPGTVHITGAGSCTITASQHGNANYKAATDVPQSFSIGKANQTISFDALAPRIFGDPDFTVNATSDSGLPVSLAALGNCAVTTVSPGTVHLSGGGSCLITASQAGTANYNAATSVPQSFTVARANQAITFAALAGKTFGDPDFTISATSTSGLPVGLAATGNCTVTPAGLVHLTGSGACTINASQDGDLNYNPATAVSQGFNIAKASQTISFEAVPNKTFGAADFEVSATANSGLPVSLVASGNCTVTPVSPGTVHLMGSGSCIITASQVGNSSYKSATNVSRSFSIAKDNQTIAFGVLSSKMFGNPDFIVNATASSGLPVSFSATGNCTVSGNNVHLTGAGSCTITASQAGDGNYNAAAPAPQSFSTTKANQTITFAALVDKTYGDADYSVSATASSGLPVTFSASGACTIAGNTVHLTGAGSCIITSFQAGDSNYAAAPSESQSFNIARASQTITFAALADRTYGDADFSVSATASSDLSVSLSASGACTIAGNTVHLTGAGPCTITSFQAGDSNYTAAPSESQSFNIARASQTITFAALADRTFGDADFSVSATATSGLSVSLSASGACTIAGNTVHLTGAGSCTITSSQAGDSNYTAAPSESQSFNIARASQTITFAALVDKTFGDPDFTLSANASSGLSVSLSAAGACTISGNTVHLTGAGACSITASQAGDTNYDAAASAPQSFNVTKANQTITFGALADKTLGDPDFAISAAATSSLPVSFSASGNCSVGSTMIHLTGAGSCTITASQGGNKDFNPAHDVPQSFSISVVVHTPSLTSATTTANTQTTSGLVISRNPADGIAVSHFKITGISGGSLFKNDGITPINNGDFITFAEGNSGLKFTPGTSNGSFTVQASTSASDAGLGGGTVQATITVNPLTAVIRFSAANYSVTEVAGFKTITVERSGDTSQAVTVDYASSDHSTPADFIPCTSPGAGFASSRCDFTTAVGTLRFAAGETSKSFNVLIGDDNYLEGPEALELTLSNPSQGVEFGVPSTAILGITDETTEPATNPVDTAGEFVRSLYHDFLNREPDAPGLAFWTDNIEKCNDPARRPAEQTVAQCLDKQRESTAIAFFMSPEFQMTGGFVYRLYKGSLPGVPNYDAGSAGRFPTSLEFRRDMSQVAEGIVVNNQISGAVVESNRSRLAADFVQRPEFVAKYGGLNNTLYVQELFSNTGITTTDGEKQMLVDGLANGTETRASVLRKVVDGTLVISEGNVEFTTSYGQAFYEQEHRRVFVFMEYVGYLRRNPDAAGFIHWLGKLNQFHGDPFQAEMVRSFILSPEYRSRFGQ